MSVQIVSLINAPQTIDGTVLPPYGYQVRPDLTVGIVNAYDLRTLYYNVFDEEYDAGNEFSESETVAIKDAVAIGLATYSADYTAAQLTALAAAGGLTPNTTYITSDTGLRYYASDESTLEFDPPGGASGIPVMWGPFTGDTVVKGVAGDPGTVLAIFCSASSSGNITLRNASASGGGAVVSPLVEAVTMSAGQMIVCGPVDCSNGIFLDLNSGTGTFYVIGT